MGRLGGQEKYAQINEEEGLQKPESLGVTERLGFGEIRNGLSEIDERLARIQTVVGEDAFFEFDEAKDDLRKAFEDKVSMDSALQRLENELDAKGAGTVSDDQIQGSQELLGSIHVLGAKVDEIENSPYVIDLLFAEANAENEMRNTIVEKALEGKERIPKESEIMSQAVQRFLTEEFEFRGFDEIEDPKEREEAMRAFTKGVVSQVSGEIDRSPEVFDHLNEGERVGILLKNLVGKHGTMAGTDDFFACASGARDLEKKTKNESVDDYMRAHLGT